MMSNQISADPVDRSGRTMDEVLSKELNDRMCTLFRTDFSEVRIHIGIQAQLLGAKAFTHGNDIYFAPGTCQPETREGRRLLAHELTHVVQQRAGRVNKIPGLGLQMVLDPNLEREAELFGWWAVEGTQPLPYRGRQKGNQICHTEVHRSDEKSPAVAIQPALQKTPRAVTLGELMAFYRTLNSTWNGAFGKAETPKNYRIPRLSGAKIISPADPGTNEARYVGMGIHESSSGLSIDRYKKYGDEGLIYCVQHDINNWTGYQRIFFIMPQALAQLNKQAEAQHLSDHQIAYDRTLGLLQKILTNLQKRGMMLPTRLPPVHEIVKIIEQEMKNLKVEPQVLAYAKMGLNMNQWAAKYEELAKKSGARDSRGWHTLTFQNWDSQKSNKWDGLPIHYIGAAKAQGGDPPAYMELIKSPTFNLNRTFDQIR